MDQIEEYNPPPFEAKMSSSRFKKYVEEHDTDEAWELDALEPAVLQALITTNVERFFDQAEYEEQQAEVEKIRELVRAELGADAGEAVLDED